MLAAEAEFEALASASGRRSVGTDDELLEGGAKEKEDGDATASEQQTPRITRTLRRISMISAQTRSAMGPNEAAAATRLEELAKRAQEAEKTAEGARIRSATATEDARAAEEASAAVSAAMEAASRRISFAQSAEMAVERQHAISTSVRSRKFSDDESAREEPIFEEVLPTAASVAGPAPSLSPRVESSYRAHTAFAIVFPLASEDGFVLDVVRYMKEGKQRFSVPLLGIDLRAGAGVSGAVVSQVAAGGPAATVSSSGGDRLQEGDVIRSVDGVMCSTFSEVIELLRAVSSASTRWSSKRIVDREEVTIGALRKHVVVLLESRMEMLHRSATRHEWIEYAFTLKNDRTLRYAQPARSSTSTDAGDRDSCSSVSFTAGADGANGGANGGEQAFSLSFDSPVALSDLPMGEGEITLWEINTVTIVSAREMALRGMKLKPGVAGYLKMTNRTGAETTLRSRDLASLYDWHHELRGLLPNLQSREIFEGWLWKKGSARRPKFRRRYPTLPLPSSLVPLLTSYL